MNSAAVGFVVILMVSMTGACSEFAFADDAASAGVSSDDSPSYVGVVACARCHAREAGLWRGSHHDLAMQPANHKTVLGDFNGSRFEKDGVTSTFFQRDGKLFVNTDGADGKLRDFQIQYTFGVFPLQQYLIKFPDGRLQALSIAWDSRPVEQGGGRWFHLYPDESIPSADELHWTGLNQNWNFMCADCHSTNVRKNYSLESKTYATTWSEIDVACEACHGPGSRHLAWAANARGLGKFDKQTKGLTHIFNERQGVSWHPAQGAMRPVRSVPRTSEVEIQVCATCHARRTQLFESDRRGEPLLDNYLPSLLAEGLYHADGQIDGEVYEYGSFGQSRMYRAGVTCSDCHEPHSLKLRKSGNGVCLQCHARNQYDTERHHFHRQGAAGARCVSCHMPAKNFMVIDARRDHSLRIPRPDLSVLLGVPNPCTQCHTGKAPEWAAGVLEKKFGKPKGRHYGEAIHAGRVGAPDAERLLSELIQDASQPPIARATAVALMPRYLSRRSAPVLQLAGHDPADWVGLGLATALNAIPMQYRPPFGIPLLFDERRVTRALAAAALAGSGTDRLPPQAQPKFDQALDEYLNAQFYNADRPESLVNLAGIYAGQGDVEKAKRFYRDAIALAPYYTPAYINLADLYRESGRDREGAALLESALQKVDPKGPVLHALGLLMVRQGRLKEAIAYLRAAAEDPSAIDRYLYVYAIALNSSGKANEALAVLEAGRKRYPANREIVAGLIAINRDLGNLQQARRYEVLLQTMGR